MGWASDLLGPHLLVRDATGSGSTRLPTDAYLAGKARVLLYHSAHWCPPCRGFTPILAEVYEAARRANPDTAIIFVSSDFDEASFREYFGSMPWAAVPWSQRSASELGTTFGVRGIPALVALDGSDGALLTTDARSIVAAQRSFAPLAQLPRGELPVRGRALESLPSVWASLLEALTCGLCARARK